MRTNMAATSIDAKNSISNCKITKQYDRILSALGRLPNGTTRKRLALALNMEPGTVAARVNELVSASRITDGPDTRLIHQITNVKSKVIRIS